MATQPRPTKRERREVRREEDRQRRVESERRAQTMRYTTWAGAGILVIVAVLLAVGPVTAMLGRSGAAQGTQYPNQGQQHVNRGDARAEYNSNPPTSGPHDPSWANWGVHEQPLPDEQLVHNLEHGGIVVHYNCPAGCPELTQQLKDLVGGYRSKVILAPRPNAAVSKRITLSAWTWLDGFDEFDAGRIRAFIDAHKDRGPELVPD